MKFKARVTTEDGRITAGNTYQGTLVHNGFKNGLRVAVFDNRGEWMTFNPEIFVPFGGKYGY